MAIQPVVPGLYSIPLGIVSAFLLVGDDLTLIDTGVPGSAARILDAVRALGRQPGDIRHILVTHCHADHSGSLAALQAATGAPAYMHPADAALVRAGQSARPLRPAPGVLPALLFRLFTLSRLTPTTIPPATIEREVQDGDELPMAGGIRAIHAPGHCAGQLAFLWPQAGGVLFAADAAANLFGLGLSLVYEDLNVGRRTLARLSALDFAVACFGHGRPIRSAAAAQFRKRWGQPPF
jgi:glyoxylase-like metal-dependent hydrolase (beta-lactamase superfamily II)